MMSLPDRIFTGRNALGASEGQSGNSTYPTLPPTALPNLAAWFRFGMGTTITGLGISQWDDQSGNGRHLKQATDASRPQLQADGSIVFDGLAYHLKCDAFTFNQPETVYLLFKQLAWSNGQRIFDGTTDLGMLMSQNSVTPGLALSTAGGAQACQNTGATIGTYVAMAAVFNGASSLIQVNNNAPTTGDVGAGNGGGFVLAARGNGGNPSNIQVKEAVLFAAAHDGTTRARVMAWLQSL